MEFNSDRLKLNTPWSYEQLELIISGKLKTTAHNTGKLLDYIIDFPEDVPCGRTLLSPTSRIVYWWERTPDRGKRLIENAIVSGLSKSLYGNEELKAEAGQVVLASVASELKLDARVRDIVRALAEKARDTEAGAELLAYSAVMQPIDGSWTPYWLKKWHEPSISNWEVAYSAIINAQPNLAGLLIPSLLEREERINIVGDEVAFLLCRVFQKELNWKQIASEWIETGLNIDYAKVARDTRMLWEKAYGQETPKSSRQGLEEFEKLIQKQDE